MGVPESIKKNTCFGSVTYMNQLNFAHFDTNSNKIPRKQYFFFLESRERNKNGS